jgi:hypothetical protein
MVVLLRNGSIDLLTRVTCSQDMSRLTVERAHSIQDPPRTLSQIRGDELDSKKAERLTREP